MAKVTLEDISSGYATPTTINANNDAVEAAVENTLSRDGTGPNQMEAALDMNSQRIQNLPDAVNNSEPITLSQAASIAGVTNALTQDNIGTTLYPQTSQETSASVTPTNYYRPPGDVRRYGMSTAATAAANATAMTNAIASNSLVFFPETAGTYNCNQVTFSTAVKILGNGCTLDGGGNAILSNDTDIDFLHVDNLNFTFSTATGTQGREAFVNITVDGTLGENTTAFPQGTTLVRHDVTDLSFRNCNFNMCKVTITGDTRPVIDNCVWEHANTVNTAPAYLTINNNQDHTDDYFEAIVKDNKFRVYPPSGANVDIIKISGGHRYVQIKNNYIENRNTAAGAQVDVFTGGDKLRFIGNTMINTQFHRKQNQSLSSYVEISYDLVSGNYFELQSGHTNTTALYMSGSLWSVCNNQLVGLDGTSTYLMIDVDNTSDSGTYDSFSTDEGYGFVINGNIVDVTAGAAASKFINFQSDDQGGGACTVSGNLMVGGEDFVNGSPRWASLIGNVWTQASNASGISFNSDGPSTVIGNVSDGPANGRGISLGNAIDIGIVSDSTATPSVSDTSVLDVDYTAGNITDFTDGYISQIIVVIAGAAVTIEDNSNISLNGSANWTMANTDTLTLVNTGSIWREIARSDNS